jgi:hypothetical protein
MADDGLSAGDAPALQQGEYQERTEKMDTRLPITETIVPTLQPQSLLQFLTELFLAIILFSALWMIGPYSPIAHGVTLDNLEMRWRTFFAILCAGSSFLALIYYSSSFAITPGRIIKMVMRIRVASEKPAPGGESHPALHQRDLALVPLSAPHILSSSARAAEQLAARMERYTYTHLILGTGMGVVGLLVWYLSFFVSKIEMIPGNGWEGLAREFVPRITILVFIEVLAGFYLRQYRVAVEDLKYFLELRRHADGQRIAYAIFEQTKSDEQKIKFAMALLEDKSAVRLAQGETTTILETMKAEKNVVIETLSMLGDQLQSLTKATKKNEEPKKD